MAERIVQRIEPEAATQRPLDDPGDLSWAIRAMEGDPRGSV